jgi:hypothetical protein
MIDTLTKGKVSMGVYVKNGNWKLGQTALEIIEQKNNVKSKDLAEKATRQYTRDMKFYNNGIIAMEKSIHHYNSFNRIPAIRNFGSCAPLF